jgi:hypothetical protein
MAAEQTPQCLRCVHFYVTWDRAQPRGCHAFGILCSAYPSTVVAIESGMACQAFEKKPPAPATPRLGDATGPGAGYLA